MWINTIRTSIALIKMVMGKRPTCLLAVPVHSCKASVTLDCPVLWMKIRSKRIRKQTTYITTMKQRTNPVIYPIHGNIILPSAGVCPKTSLSHTSSYMIIKKRRDSRRKKLTTCVKRGLVHLAEDILHICQRNIDWRVLNQNEVSRGQLLKGVRQIWRIRESTSRKSEASVFILLPSLPLAELGQTPFFSSPPGLDSLLAPGGCPASCPRIWKQKRKKKTGIKWMQVKVK